MAQVALVELIGQDSDMPLSLKKKPLPSVNRQTERNVLYISSDPQSKGSVNSLTLQFNAIVFSQSLPASCSLLSLILYFYRDSSCLLLSY